MPSQNSAWARTVDAAACKSTELLAGVWQQGHEAGSLDGLRHGVLADGRASALAAADDLALPVGELFQQFHVLVIDVHRAGPLAVDKNRILLLRADLGLGAPLAGQWLSLSGHPIFYFAHPGGGCQYQFYGFPACSRHPGEG